MPEFHPATPAADPRLLVVFGHSLHHSPGNHSSPCSGSPHRAWRTVPKSAPPHFSRKRNSVTGFSSPSVTRSMRAASARPVSSSGYQHPARLSIDDLYNVAETTRVRTSLESRDQMLAKKQKTASTPRPAAGAVTAAHGFVTEVTVTPHTSLVVHPRYTFLFSASAGGARRSVSSAKPTATVGDGRRRDGSSGSNAGDKKRARSALSASAGDKHSYDEANSRSLNVSRQCCEVMGPGVCWECSKLRVRLTERARMEADFPRMRVSQQNVTTSALVTRMLPGMSPAEIQDRIVRGEIAKNRLVFPSRLNAEGETVHRQNDTENGHHDGNKMKSNASEAGDNSATKRVAHKGLRSPTNLNSDDDSSADEGVDEWHYDEQETPDMKVILTDRSSQYEHRPHHDLSLTEADDTQNRPHLYTPSRQSPDDRDDLTPSHLVPGIRSHCISNSNNLSSYSISDSSHFNRHNSSSNRSCSTNSDDQRISNKSDSHSGNDKNNASRIDPEGGKSTFGSVLMLAKLKLKMGGEPSTPLYFMDLRHMNAKILQGRAARVVKAPPARAQTPASARDATRDRLERLGLLPLNGGRESEEDLGTGLRGPQLDFVSPRKAQVTVSGTSSKGYFDPPLLSRQQQVSALSFFAGSDDTFNLSERLSPDSVGMAETRGTHSSMSITKPGHMRQKSPLREKSLVLANFNSVPKVSAATSRTHERPDTSKPIVSGKDADTSSVS